MKLENVQGTRSYLKFDRIEFAECTRKNDYSKCIEKNTLKDREPAYASAQRYSKTCSFHF